MADEGMDTTVFSWVDQLSPEWEVKCYPMFWSEVMSLPDGLENLK